MKKTFTMAAFCLAPFFVFSLNALAAADARLLTVKPGIRKNAARSGDKNGTAPGAASAAAKKDGASSAAPEVKAPCEKSGPGEHTEFDDFNNVNDPLYREGSRVLLKQAVDEDLASEAASEKICREPELMRDAPADVPRTKSGPEAVKAGDENKAGIFPAKNNRLIKLVPADPVKTKSTL